MEVAYVVTVTVATVLVEVTGTVVVDWKPIGLVAPLV